MGMRREEAIERIDDLTYVLYAEIPEEIEIFGRVYRPKEDISSQDRDGAYIMYLELYDKMREEIDHMDDVPEEIVEKAIILRRIVLFLKEYRHEDEIEEKKRWIEYAKRLM